MIGPAFIRALGISTPAPGDQRQQVAALLSGAPLFERHPKWIGADGQRQIMGFVPELRDMADFPTRVALLLHRAFLDCIHDQQARYGRIESAPLVVLMPMLLRQPVFRDAFRDAASKLNFSCASEVRLYFGDASQVLPQLHQLELSDSQPCAYVAAADSLVTPFMLDFLATQGLVRDRLNRWSAIPSEGAACLLMSRQPGIAQVLACATERETQSLSDPARSLLGRALCTAIDQALSLAGTRADEVFSDASAERWRAEELGLVKSERPCLSRDDIPWRFITQRTGDPGTAAPLISIAAVCHQQTKSLILSSDRSGGRAAAVIAMPEV